MKKSKNLFRYTAMLLFLIIGVVYYRHQRSLSLATLLSSSSVPSPSPTIEYLEYRNDRYGYAFTYPSTVSVDENLGQFGPHPADSQSKIIQLLNTSSHAPSQSFWIEEHDLPSGQTMMSHVKNINNYQNGYLENSGEAYDIRPRQKVLTLEEFLVDGKPAIKLISEVMPGEGSVIDTNFQVWINYQPSKLLLLSDPMIQYHPIEFDEQILASFRFFPPRPEPSWTKHAFSNSGFAFSLPVEWEITPSDLSSFPDFMLHHDQSVIKGHFGNDGSFGQKARLEDWSVRPDPRASYQLFSDYTKDNSYASLASIKTVNLFIMEAYIPLYNGQNLILSIDNPTLELMFYRLLNTLTRL